MGERTGTLTWEQSLVAEGLPLVRPRIRPKDEGGKKKIKLLIKARPDSPSLQSQLLKDGTGRLEVQGFRAQTYPGQLSKT